MLADVLVVAGAIGLAGFLGWFFFGKRAATEARVAGGVQEATIVVEANLKGFDEPVRLYELRWRES